MNLDKLYQNSNDEHRNILEMVREEPDWAANRIQEGEIAEIKLKQIQKKLKEIRQAIADYMRSEGCSCCQGDDHPDHEKRLAKLLRVPSYSDKSGYNFSKFQTRKSDEKTINV